jgi:demethylmenaquinone methyltransferase/2-methoxy-6-polyprenyl-1,4-benzoquinol methylase
MQISRVTRTKEDARKSYDRMSSIYDGLAGSAEFKYALLGLEMLATQPGECVLEIGCGTGKGLVELCHRSGESRKVHALDLSPGMLQKSRERLARAGVRQRVTLLEGDGISLPYKNGSFNAVFLCFTLELFDTPEIPLVLAECQRILQISGRLGVVSMLKSDHQGWIERLYEWFHDKLPTYVDCRPIDAHRLIQEAGFSIEKRQVRNMWGLPLEIVIARKV